MAKNYWFSADEDTGDVVAKTEIKSDGKVRRYEYTKPDNIKAGHGDTSYQSYKDFEDDNPDWGRDKNDPKSVNRRWYGNGYDLALEVLSNLSLEELQELLEASSENYVHTSEEMVVRGTHKQLVLK